MKTEVDDWLTELPPLDGEDEEPGEFDDVADDLPAESDDASLDDATADDLDVGIGTDITDEESSDDAAAARASEADDERWEADVGEPDIDLAPGESALGDDGEPTGLGEVDFDDHEELPASDDDAGEEGTTDPVEHSLDEELPAMDADDDGDFEDEELLQTGEIPHDAESLRWADAGWSERLSLGRAPSWSTGDDDPLVAITSLPEVELLVAVAKSGALWVSRDGDMAAVRARGDYDHVATHDGEAPFVLATIRSGVTTIWLGDTAGRLVASDDYGASFRRCVGLGRPVLALSTREDGSLVALASHGATLEVLTSSDGATWFGQRVTGDIAAFGALNAARARWMVCRGAAVAIGDALGALVARDGRHFIRVPATDGAVAAVFGGVDARAPLVLAGPFGDDDELHLLRVPFDAPPEIVAELPSRGVALGLAWLAARGAALVLLHDRAVVWGPPAASGAV
jgi:hypothetical protein